mgnify:CR=1 FL=1
MSETDLHAHAEDIRDQFADHLDVSTEDIASRLETLVGEYNVPVEEARRSVVSHYLDRAGIDRDDLDDDNEATAIADVDAPEQWITVEATVVDLWEPRSDAVAQVGLLGDPTGTIKFTKWAKSDLPALEEGAAYRLQNVVTDEYQGRFSVKLNRTTTIDRLETDIDVGEDTETVEGALIDIQSGSGLIKRCPEPDCTRVLQNGRCSEHGDVDGEFDLRIKGVLDDGRDAHEVIFDREATEALTGIALEEAKDMAMDALDTTVVIEEMRSSILGRYYRVEGPVLGRYLLVEDFEALDAADDVETTLIKARSM